MGDVLRDLLESNNIRPGSFIPVDRGEIVFQGEAPLGKTAETWAKLANGFKATGYWPIIRGDVRDVVAVDAADILTRVPSGDIRQLLRPRARLQLEQLRVLMTELPASAAEALANLDDNSDFDQMASAVDRSGIHSFSARAVPEDPWPAEPIAKLGKYRFQTLKRSKGPSIICLVRCAHPYESPAYLGFGGWNDCPESELIVASLREWRNNHGAIPACMTGDVLECAVIRPPLTEEEAMRVAAEQWIFCDDIVGQGTQSVRKLAIEIWKSPNWFFWWD